MLKIPSILVIDDNAEARQTLARLLSALGAPHVHQASSGEEALEILRTQSFNLILADYRLEGMTGVEFLERLRAQGNQTPVLMLSGSPDKDGVIRATQQPKADFYAKPFRVAELTVAMERLAA
jgi:CheY-like chemotaxis protein